jgi:hypothetical protein
MDAAGFAGLMHGLAQAWEDLDTERAVDCFTTGAVYIEPPDTQLFEGREQLRAYFGALTGGTFMRFHNLWFDEERQVGAAEYSFGLAGSEEADHGVVVAEIVEDRIALWREYQRKGPLDFDRFLAREGKNWEWHIGNYP